jgi:hypothetical protein
MRLRATGSNALKRTSALRAPELSRKRVPAQNTYTYLCALSTNACTWHAPREPALKSASAYAYHGTPKGAATLPPGGYRDIAPGGYRHIAPGGCRHIAPGGCRHIAPGGYRHIAPGGYRHIAPGGCRHIAPGGCRHIAPGGCRHIAPGGCRHMAPRRVSPHCTPEVDGGCASHTIELSRWVEGAVATAQGSTVCTKIPW